MKWGINHKTLEQIPGKNYTFTSVDMVGHLDNSTMVPAH